MSEIRTKPATKEYRDNWDRVFGKTEPAVGPTLAVAAMEAMIKAVTREARRAARKGAKR